MNDRIRAAVCVAAVAITAGAGRIERGTYHSALLARDIGYIAALPDSYAQRVASGKRFPVVYLLHCAGCDTSMWYNNPGYCTPVQELVDSAGVIFAGPDDGQVLSWWLDSPVRDHSAYSSFLAFEFKPHIDSLYATERDAAHTGLAGHSMGGFGALHNLIRHPDIFGAAFSMKGAADIMPYSGSWGLPAVLGNQATGAANWHAVNPVEHACELAGHAVALRTYSGPLDWFYAGNLRLHQVLDSCGIAHRYNIDIDSLEGHASVSPREMRHMADFFDSVFSVASAGVRHAPGARSTRPWTRVGRREHGTMAWTITGRALGSMPGRPYSGKSMVMVVIQRSDGTIRPVIAGMRKP